VNTSRSSNKSLSAVPEEGLMQKWSNFWFSPVHPVGLHIVRVLAGLLFIAWLLPFSGELDSLFGLNGFFDRQGYADFAKLQEEMARQAQQPPESAKMTNWSILYQASSPQALHTMYLLSIGVLVLFTLGVATRITAVLTWVVVVSFTASPALSYDADAFLLMLAFYLMIGYVLLDQRTVGLSWLQRTFGAKGSLLFSRLLFRTEERPSLAANLALRLVQIHLAVIIVTSGLHKLQFGDWWAGLAFWYPLYRPAADVIDRARQQIPNRDELTYLLSVGAYATLAWQIGFPLYAWRRGWWRGVLLAGAFVGAIGSAFLFKLPLLGPTLFVCCLAFVDADAWLRLFDRLAQLPGLSWLARREPEATAEKGDSAAPESEESETFITVGHR
jgi:hypothetical protein